MADQFDNNKDNDQEQKYEKFCFLCRRPESQAGKMIDLPNNIHICADCMQKSFDTMNTQMSNGNYSDLFNMPNISMIDLGSLQNQMGQQKKPKKKKPGKSEGKRQNKQKNWKKALEEKRSR